jgi:hypothetical protein
MTTLEDAFYDFEKYDIDVILNKKTLGGRTPIPIKPCPIEISEYELSPFFEESKMDGSLLEPIESTAEETMKKSKYNTSIFKKKYYIRPNQECPICLEPIMTKTSAFLTPCGHGFHKKCMHQAFQCNWLTKQAGACCPLCRYNDVGDYCVEKYCCWNEDANELDCLENFWMNKDIMLATPCYDGKHYIGIDKNCKYCKKYRHVKRYTTSTSSADA